jgi:uncharacterized protein (DUF58 family)
MARALKAGKSSYSVSSYFVISLSIVFLGIIAFIAAAASSIALAVFSATTFSLMLAIRLWGGFAMAQLEVVLSCDGYRHFLGDTFSLHAEIANRKILPVRMRLKLDLPDALKPLESGNIEGESGLLPFEKISGSWSFRADRRGVHRLGPVTLVAGDLLDLYREEKVLPFNKEIVVYPRLIPVGDLDLPFRDYFGIRHAKGIIEDPAWYEGTREYTGNRPAKNIHWKASARFNALQEKIFEPTMQQKLFILLDGEGFKRADDKEGFESALEIAASLAARFAEKGASFAIATDRHVQGFPAVLPLGRGPEHLGMFLELLARCEFERGQDMFPLIEGVDHQGVSFIAIARKPGENMKKFFALPAIHRDRVVFIFAEAEKSKEESAYPFITFDALRTENEGEQ